MSTDPYKLFKRAVSNLDWPKREKRDDPVIPVEKCVVAYQQELKVLKEAGWLANPLFVTWDDWNLSLGKEGAWDLTAPSHYFSNDAKRVHALMALWMSAARECGIIFPQDQGMSFFVHRHLREKKIIHLHKLPSGGTADIQSASDANDLVIFNIPSLQNHLFDKKIVPPPAIKPGAISRGELRNILQGWITDNLAFAIDELDRKKLELEDLVNPVLNDACEKLFKKANKREKTAVKDALISMAIFFSIKYPELNEVYYIPSRGFTGIDNRGEVEECSGGIYFWSSEAIAISELEEIRAYDSYRGLRTSIVDWSKKHSQELRKELRKSARTVIMSRNLSHNMGSHSLANPHLYDSIGITQLTDSTRNTKEIGKQIKQRLETFHSYAQGRLDFLARTISGSADRPEPLFFLNDVMERGFFSQGVLLDTLVQDTGFPAKMIEFHVIIQRPDNNQNTGPGSNGFSCAIYEWIEKDRQFVRTNESDIEDVIVGIPGGMIGTHALYAFLENVLRNAVKYGQGLSDLKPQEQGGDGEGNGEESGKLKIHLRLEQCKGLRDDKTGDYKAECGWVLSIWDNVSRDDGSVAFDIRTHINRDLITKKDEMETRGHGIQEMKLCAESLSGRLQFPPDDGYEENENDDSCKHCDDACTASHEYSQYRKSTKHPYKVNITAMQPLRCYSAQHSGLCHDEDNRNAEVKSGKKFNIKDRLQNFLGDGAAESKAEQTQPDGWLTYNLFIPIPILLGVVAPEYAKKDEFADKLPPHIRYYETVEQLAEEGAHIGILLDANNIDMDEILKDIARLHPCLPFRLMVVTDVQGKTRWEKALKGKHPDNLFKWPDHIPENRLRICGGEVGRKLCGLLKLHNNNECFYLGAGGEGEERWDAIVLRAYDAWLREFKPLPEKVKAWKLCVGFQHGGEAVKSRWEKNLQNYKQGTDTVIACYVLSKENKEQTDAVPVKSPNWPENLIPGKNGCDIDTYLVFDNHGAAFRDFTGRGDKNNLDEYPRFYQKIGLSDSLNLFQSLGSPPASPLGFSLFLYSLVESALARVVVIDERVAQSTAEDNGVLFASRDKELKVAGIFPLLSMARKNVGNGKSISTISRRIHELLEVTITVNLDVVDMTEDLKNIWKQIATWYGIGDDSDDRGEEEGLIYTGASCEMRTISCRNDGIKSRKLEEIDVLIIHEGVTDHLHNAGIWQDSLDDVFRLHECAPMVVRCSGRGRESRHLHNSLSFMEFTEVSQNIYQSLNKPALVKSVLGSAGNLKELPEESGK